MLTRVAPEIPVADLEEALAYYGSKLGFALEMKMPDGDYAIVERDDVALHFTDAIEELHAEIEGRGAKFCRGSFASRGATGIFE
jgi:catechol 2,3-dioxygenase-like lactoylglutathione lyase family enzyme